MRYFGYTMQSCAADAQSCAPASFCMSEKFVGLILGTAWLAVSVFICSLLVDFGIRLWLVVVLLSLLCFAVVLLFRRKAPNKAMSDAIRSPGKHLG